MASSETLNSLEAIAIIGWSGRFPGARSVDELWQNLRLGIESIRPLSDAELLAAGVAPEVFQAPNYVKAASWLDDPDQFDAAFFGFNPREAEITDPQHRLFLECSHEALEVAGYDPQTYQGLIGVFAGSSMSTYFINNLLSNPALVEAVGTLQAIVGNDKDYVPTRVSYKLNLRGPSVNVQTACSTSLVAVHLACQSLLEGACDIALAGGVSVDFPQRVGYQYQEEGILSPDGHCRAFDAKANGTVGASGVGVVAIKRLSDAQADGDTILAVIRGSAINNDGSLKVGYTAPSVEGQAEVIAAAQAVAGVGPESISYVETHGTGTHLGDPIEMAALTQAFRAGTEATSYCAIGSVKTNLGHLNAAAGVTGLIKTALQLLHKQLVPSLHFSEPNPKIDFVHSPFFVNDRLREWDTDGVRRAAVSSFGLGGTNAHVVLEEAPAPRKTGSSRPEHLLTISAKTAGALERATERLGVYLQDCPAERLPNVAYTLHAGRTAHRYRRAVVCSDPAATAKALASPATLPTRPRIAEEGDPSLVFLFPGGGAQHVGMGAQLYQTERVYRDAVDECAEILRDRLGCDIRTVMFPLAEQKATSARQLAQTTLGLPALFVTEYALAMLLMSWSLRPAAMVGHSLGEYTAACLSGVFSLEDALTVVAARSRLMSTLSPGGMVIVPLAEADVQPLLGPELSIAAVNGDALCVVSGFVSAIESFEQLLASKGLESQRVHIEVASHSPTVEPMLEEFLGELRSVRLNAPIIPYLSNRTGTWITAAEVTAPEYWAGHLRHAVRFADAVGELMKEPSRMFVEIGPGRTLSTLAARHRAAHPDRVMVPTMRHPQDAYDDNAFLMGAIGQLWSAGARIDWKAFHRGEQLRRVQLPSYPFERRRYWVRPNTLPAAGAMTGQRNIADWFYVPVWKQAPRPVPSVESLVPRRYLVFLDDLGVGEKLAETLRRLGDVTCVRRGERFQESDICDYVINPASSDDYERLLERQSQLGREADVIVHMWNVSSGEPLDRTQEAGFYSLTFLAQALGNHAGTQRIDLRVVSSNMHRISAEAEVWPEKATLLGPSKVIPQEYAFITCQSVDLDLAAAVAGRPEAAAHTLARELATSGSDQVVALRGGDRWVQSFESIRLERNTATSLFVEGGTYLLTGGLGGIALEVAEALSRNGNVNLVLSGRSPFPEQQDWAEWEAAHGPDDPTSRKIRRLQSFVKRGAGVLVARADVSDLSSMREVVKAARARFGPITGVFHTAGTPGGGVIQLKTADMARSVIDPKVTGTLVLDTIFRDEQPDFVVLFSSLSGIVGGIGHVDYAAGNAFLDAFAQSRRHIEHPRTVAVNLNTWRGVGMAANLEVPSDLQHRLDEVLRSGIEPAEGVEAIQRILVSGLAQCAISTRNLSALEHDPYSERQSSEHDADADVHDRPLSDDSYVSPRNELEQQLVGLWQGLLGIDRLGIHDNFFVLGGHSLLGTRLMSRIRDAFGVQIPLRCLFEQPTVAALAVAVAAQQTAAESLQDAEMLEALDRLSDEEIEAELARRTSGQPI